MSSNNYNQKFNLSNKQIISYAQNGEDIVLNRVFSKIKSGFYIDIGAADPVINSVTNLFYQKGWRGINIEPNPVFFQQLQSSRKNDINLNIGIGLKTRTAVFYDCQTVKEWSTFSSQQYLTHKSHNVLFEKTKVKIDSLENILDEYKAPKKINFLKIDVEGLEEQVLKSNNWQKYRPIIVVIESSHPQICHSILSKNNYIKVLDDGLNIFYLDNKHILLIEYLKKPANVTDNFIPYLYHQQFVEFQEKEKQLHQQFSYQYSLVETELKKTQSEFQKLSQAYTKLLNTK